jgi:predicted phosphate transport protein (TIGR00153 family)
VFKNKKDKFSVLLESISANLKEGAYYFADYKLKNASDLQIFSEEMKNFETKGDEYIHQTIKELNNSFITPIEREDILALAMSMDDVLDGLEETAAIFNMYSVTQADEYMLKFVDAIRSCTDEIVKAIELLSAKKLPAIRTHAIKIKDYETICDGVLRQSIKHIFTVEKDPIRLIKIKEIYENLEEIADSCQDVANTLETIVMKNA